MNWRYWVPRRRYFRSLRVAKTSPEIAWHVDEQARLKACAYAVGLVYWPTFGLAALLSAGIVLVFGFILAKLPAFPDFEQRRMDLTKAAWAIVPLDEIRRRMGDDVPRILPKKTDWDSTENQVGETH